MKVAILGCGPSGLVAAHAARRQGAVVTILSRNVKSPIHGAQYLHRPIPGDPHSEGSEPTVIRYRMQGNPEAYLRKVYGATWDGTISDDLRDQEHLAWDIRGSYNWLWQSYRHLIVGADFSALNFGRWYEELRAQADLVINTLPRTVLCNGGHNFVSTHIYAIGDTPDRRVDFPVEDGEIVYNGEEAPSWYRLANVHGFKTVEWPEGARPPVEGVARVAKPLRHNCDCWPALEHVGRFGRWQNKKLVHEVYDDVRELIALAEMKEKLK